MPAIHPQAPVRVLVIDDEADVRDLVAAACEAVGLNCTVTTEYEKFRQALDPDVAVLVIDLRMPGVDGIEVLRHLASERCRARIILMSGFDRKVLHSAEELAQSLGLEIAGRLVKPFRLAEVEALLAGAVARRIPKAAPAREVRELTTQELREALEGDRVVVHYQPQVELSSGRLVGVEALARLRHPERGIVYPDAFIGVAERSAQIEMLTTAVLRSSVSEFGALQLGREATLSINVSALTLTDIVMPDLLVSYIAGRGMRPESLVMEITESGLIKQLSAALDILARLRLKGVGLSIDDFGTGYSSMAQLRRIPATELKIDRQFVQGMLSDDGAATMAEKTIELGHDLGMRIVAEGVETAEQAAALRSKGCDIGQGYYYAKPMPRAELEQWIKRRG